MALYTVSAVQYSAVLSHVTTERGGQCQARAAGFVEKWDKIYSKYFNLFPVICLIYPDLLLIFTAFHIFLRLIILMYSFHDNHFYSTTIIYNSSSLFHLLKIIHQMGVFRNPTKLFLSFSCMLVCTLCAAHDLKINY